MKVIKGLIKEYHDILLVWVAILLCEFFLRFNIGMDYITKQATLFDIYHLLILTGVLFIFKRKGRFIIELLTILYFSIYSFAQSVHFVFFSNLFSYRKLSLASELGEVKDTIFSGLKIEQLLFLIPVAIVIITYVIHKGDVFKIERKIRYLFAVLCVVLGIALDLLHVELLRQDYLIDHSWDKDYYLHEVMQNRYKFMDHFGVFEYNIKDIMMTFTSADTELTEEEKAQVDDFVERYSKREDNAYTGLLDGKNLILILCESFDESAIDEELTPTLYKLKSEGYYFDRHYAPIYEVATGDSEFISETGMLPSINNGTTSYTFNLNAYPYALANLFKEKGYTVNSYHSYTGNFYNRESMHESFGFDTFFDMDKLELERWEGYREAANWILDEDLFEAVLQNTDFNEPLFDFVITASGHMSYNSGRTELKEYYEIVDADERFTDYSEEAKYYLAAQMSLDRGLEVLLDGLENRGVLEDTVIYMFADHYPYGITSDQAKAEILGDTETYEVYKVPMLIYSSDLGSGIHTAITSTFDIYPTIANLFDLNDQDAYKVGNDAFDSDALCFIPFFDRSFLCEEFYYDSSQDTVPEDHLDIYQEISKKINEIFEYSQDILLSDYYGID